MSASGSESVTRNIVSAGFETIILRAKRSGLLRGRTIAVIAAAGVILVIVYCAIRYLRQLSTEREQIKLGNKSVLNPNDPYKIIADKDPFLNATAETKYKAGISDFNRIFIDHRVHFEGKRNYTGPGWRHKKYRPR